MFKLTCVGPERSDATAPFEVTLDKEYTVQSFVHAVLVHWPRWFGYIQINNGERKMPLLEYKYGEILSNAIGKFYSKRIVNVTAEGGYTWMSFLITLEE